MSLDEDFVRTVAERFAAGKRLRYELPGEGRLHIDRPLPFLCLRRRRGRKASRVDRLVTTQGSYLVTGGPEVDSGILRRLVDAIAERGIDRHGGFLILEIWEDDPEIPDSGPVFPSRPAFTVAATACRGLTSTLQRLRDSLERLEIGGARARVVDSTPGRLRKRNVHLVASGIARRDGCFWIGLGVAPVYRSPAPDTDGTTFYPMVLLKLEIGLARVVLETVYEFAHAATDLEPSHPQALGRRALVRSAWNIDRRLAEVADSFEFLRLSTPVNEQEAWQEFADGGRAKTPVFHYAPLPIDAEAIKRKLFNLPIERVEDPTLSRLFREKQEELDKRINMLRDRGTPDYLYGSLQLYGPVSDRLLHLAEQLLYRLPSHERDDTDGGYVTAAQMVARAEAEIDSYRSRYAEFPKRVQLRRDIPPGLMVSQDALLVSTRSRIPRRRVEALIHHEVGTHLLTYCNGRAQRLRLLYIGLPGYEALQEGLAVLAEFLAGGLSRPRLRMLAARVVTCHALTAGAGFRDAFDLLVDDHGFPARTAFTVVTRVYRSGGLTKDAVYLEGLAEILEYLGSGGRLEPLFVGKVAPHHLDDIEELARRGVLVRAPLAPNYLRLEEANRRLDQVRQGLSVLDLAAAAEPRSS